jgi:hypothetical protein
MTEFFVSISFFFNSYIKSLFLKNHVNEIMGNNQGGFHKRERTGDGSQRGLRFSSTSGHSLLSSSIGDDGCPVQVTMN